MREKPALGTSKCVVVVNGLAAGALMLGLAWKMWGQPILADEWDFYKAATDWWHYRAYIPHPQAYVHLLQLSMALFGESAASARLPGVLASLISVALIPPFVQSLIRDDARANRIAIAAIWLYVLCPLTVQNMMLVDIDNTILVPVLLGLLWLWQVARTWPPMRRIGWVGLMFGLALWVKLPTPCLFMACIVTFHALRRELRLARDALLSLAGGAVFFVATFALYAELTGFTFARFGPTFAKAPRDLGSLLLLLPQGLGVFLTWLSLPVTMILVLAAVRGLTRLAHGRLADQDLLTVLVVTAAVGYALIIPPAWGYPRYQAPILPLVAVLVAIWLVPSLEKVSSNVRVMAIGVGAAVVVYQVVVVGDPFRELYQITFETGTGDLAQRFHQGARVLINLALPLGVALIGVSLAAWKWKIKPFASVLMVALGALAFAQSAGAVGVQVPASYSTRYRYGYGYDDLRAAIDDVKQAGGYALAVKEVLYYAGVPGEDAYFAVCGGCSPQALVDKIRSQHASALVWTSKEEARFSRVVDDPAVRHLLEACYSRRTRGVFVVYLRRPDVVCW